MRACPEHVLRGFTTPRVGGADALRSASANEIRSAACSVGTYRASTTRRSRVTRSAGYSRPKAAPSASSRAVSPISSGLLACGGIPWPGPVFVKTPERLRAGPSLFRRRSRRDQARAWSRAARSARHASAARAPQVCRAAASARSRPARPLRRPAASSRGSRPRSGMTPDR